MQNAVYERKQNGEGFFSLPAVTYSRFGNCPANGLVTEQPQYSVIICIFSTWQNAETKLISNGLRFIFTCPLFLAQPITFHVSRHTHATMMITLGADLYTVSKLLGHTNIQVTQIYAKIVDESKKKAIDLIPNFTD
ncbi:Tyrosine recombinase XerC [Parabacteroides distasonis]|uniref:Tyrosine recombinase XerC n=1 Tax=Parabacteroides distasonis TaxID=823 RepID=A0A174XFN3_PARDI|nr:Tyrosine recombinase XerC [Parabacteroides distasonis]